MGWYAAGMIRIFLIFVGIMMSIIVIGMVLMGDKEMYAEKKYRVWSRKEHKFEYMGYTESLVLSLDDYDVMEYTGRLADNGDEVCEGDIVDYIVEGTRFGYKGSATIDSVHNDEVMEILDTADSVTIIGNIYDNMDM